MTENEISREIVNAAFHLHRTLGPGLFETVYEAIIASELEKLGLLVARQQAMPITYNGTRYELGFRADLIVGKKVVVEIKSVAALADVHKTQLLTYLRLADKRLAC